MSNDFSNLFSVKGKTVVITGGSRGIGEMLAAGYLASGARVIISSRKADACEETVERLKSEYGGEIYAIPSDVGQMVGIQHLADEIAKREEKVDVLINNAGVAWGATLEEFPESGWDKVMDVNVKGIFFLFQKLIPLLRKSASPEDPARVINIASIDGMHTSPFSGYAYGTSKAAVIHLTRFMASQHVGEHILVNGIAPGPFPTWMLSTGVGLAARPKASTGTPSLLATRRAALARRRTSPASPCSCRRARGPIFPATPSPAMAASSPPARRQDRETSVFSAVFVLHRSIKTAIRTPDV